MTLKYSVVIFQALEPLQPQPSEPFTYFRSYHYETPCTRQNNVIVWKIDYAIFLAISNSHMLEMFRGKAFVFNRMVKSQQGRDSSSCLENA
jgi:hypothetical protein